MAPGDACEVGQRAKEIADRRPRRDLVLGGDRFRVSQRSEHRRRRHAADPADAAHLREVEIHPAGERLHQRSKLRFRRGQAAHVEALRFDQQLFEGGQRLRRQQVRKHLREVRAGPLEIERVRRTDGGDRPRLHDPEAGFVAAPLHVLRRAVVRFHFVQERRQRCDLVVAQRRGAVRAAFAEASQEQLIRAFADDVLIRIDQAADQRLAKPASRVDDDLVRAPGDRIDGEADAGYFRPDHSLDQNGDFDRFDGQPGRLSIGMRARRPRRRTTGRHCGREPGRAARRAMFRGYPQTTVRDCPRRCPTTGRQRGSRPARHRTTDAPRPPQLAHRPHRRRSPGHQAPGIRPVSGGRS